MFTIVRWQGAFIGNDAVPVEKLRYQVGDCRSIIKYGVRTVRKSEDFGKDQEAFYIT